MGEQLDKFALGDVINLSGVFLFAHEHLVASPRLVADAALFVGGEMAEVPGSLHIAAPVGRLVEDVERAVVALENDGLEAVAGAHLGIVLGAPCDKVGTIGSGEARGMVVELPDGAPGAVGGPHDIGLEHALLGSPLAVVGGAQLAYLLPYAFEVEVGGMESASLVGGVDEYFARDVVAFFLGVECGRQDGHRRESDEQVM